MNPEQFAYWVQGMLEYTDVGTLSDAEVRKKLNGIKDHVALVFNKVTPSPKIEPKKHTFDMDKIAKDITERQRKEAEGDRSKLWPVYGSPGVPWPYIPPGYTPDYTLNPPRIPGQAYC